MGRELALEVHLANGGADHLREPTLETTRGILDMSESVNAKCVKYAPSLESGWASGG